MLTVVQALVQTELEQSRTWINFAMPSNPLKVDSLPCNHLPSYWVIILPEGNGNLMHSKARHCCNTVYYMPTVLLVSAKYLLLVLVVHLQTSYLIYSPGLGSAQFFVLNGSYWYLAKILTNMSPFNTKEELANSTISQLVALQNAFLSCIFNPETETCPQTASLLCSFFPAL